MIKSFIKTQFFLIPIVGVFFITANSIIGTSVILGYLISTVFVLVSVWIIDRFWDVKDQSFIKVFFISMPIRFIVVIGLLVFVISSGKIDEIYFTVSFIISYLCQSITELIFLNKILLPRSTK